MNTNRSTVNQILRYGSSMSSGHEGWPSISKGRREAPTDLSHMLPPPIPSVVSMAVGAVLRGHDVPSIIEQTRLAHVNRRQMKQFLAHPELLRGPKGVPLD